jgi:O-antigen/teichoic acid export membrane protein
VLTGTAAAQILNFATAPLLTRLYSPADFSALAVFTAIVAVCLAFATGRYEFGLVLARSSRTQSRLMVLSIVLAACTSVLLEGLLLLTAGPLGCLVPPWASVHWLWLTPCFLFVCACTTVASQWLVAQGRFWVVGNVDLVALAVSVAAQVLAVCVLGWTSGTALIAGLLLGRVVALGYLAHDLVPFLWKRRRSLSLPGLRKAAGQFWRFPAFSTLSELASGANAEAPKLLLGACFPPHVLGLFALCSRVLEKPVQLASTSLGPAFFRQVSTMRDKPRQVRRLLLRVACSLFAMALPPMLIVCSWGDTLFEFTFGAEWRQAGDYARLLAPMLAVRFAVIPTWTALLASSRQHVLLLWTSSYLVVTIMCFSLPGVSRFPTTAILLYALASIVMYVALFAVNLISAGKSPVRAGRRVQSVELPPAAAA